ncbi:hypothetical protein [Elizabethkingia phage TCUEAP2]|nr:hypothetical protein [Elizabethkingia phage TCUEAP2]
MKGRIKRPEANKVRLILPRVGFIKIGMKTERGLPQSVDYFIPVGKYAGLFTQAYGERPQTIQIVFPDDDPEKVCNERFEYRDDEGRLIAEGNGELFKVWDGTKYEELTVEQYPNLMQSIAKRYPNKAVKKGGDGWKITLTLNFIVPLVRGVAGVWQFTTNGSASTIPAIRETFDGMLAERGFCKGIIFDLNVQFATTQKPGDKSRFPVVSLVPNESDDNVLKVKKAFEPNKRIE